MRIEIVPVETVSEVLKHALVRQPEPIDWDEEEAVDVAAVQGGKGGAGLRECPLVDSLTTLGCPDQ